MAITRGGAVLGWEGNGLGQKGKILFLEGLCGGSGARCGLFLPQVLAGHRFVGEHLHEDAVFGSWRPSGLVLLMLEKLSI
jgi:hypothetical protein